MCSDLLLTNTIISLLLWDNEVASVLFPLPSAILNKDVPTTAAVTVDSGPEDEGVEKFRGHTVCHRSGGGLLSGNVVSETFQERRQTQLEHFELKMQFQDTYLTPVLRVSQPL